MERKDITLLVIESAGDEGLSPIQIQKSLFLIGESHLPELPSDFYDFYPYNYGPFTEEVYDDVDVLVDEGMIAKVLKSGESWFRYVVTPKGRDRIQEIIKESSDELNKYAIETVKWVCSLSFSELLRAIYAKYPDYKINSVFQG